LRNVLRKLGGFSLASVLNAFAPLIILPFVARLEGPVIWGAVGVGIAIGNLVAALSYAGWSIAGTPAVALARADQTRRDLYSRAFWSRCSVLLVLTPLGVIASVLLVPTRMHFVAASYVVAFAIGGISLSWYAVGVSSPAILMSYETLPKVLAAGAALLIIQWAPSPYTYPILVVAATAIGLVAFHLRTHRKVLPPKPADYRTAAALRHHGHAWIVEATGAGFSLVPVPIAASFVSTPSLAQYTSADRLYRYGFAAINSTANAMQGWVLENATQRRHRLAIATHLVLGIVGAALLVLVGPYATRLLFGQANTAPLHLFIGLGIAFFSNAVSTPFVRNVIMPQGRARELLWATALSGSLGILVMIVATSLTHNPIGATIGLAISEGSMLVSCLWISSRPGQAREATVATR
jgi:PST family polysaccharide transporter